jgi:hypothetical protein
VLEAYFGAALERCKDVPDLTDPTEYLEARLLAAVEATGGLEGLRRVKPVGVNLVARLSFEKAFGISVQRQVEIERKLQDGMKFPHEKPGYREWVKARTPWSSFEVEDGPFGDMPCDQLACWLDSK